MPKKIDHAFLVQCGTNLPSDELMWVMQATTEGIIEGNVRYFERGGLNPNAPLPRYEKPRPGKFTFNGESRWIADQVIAMAEVIDQRQKATCIEWCCYRAAELRFSDGIPAECLLVPIWGKHDRAVPYQYHAIVRMPDGTLYDATAELPGYGSDDPWWQVAGHCCPDCALEAAEQKRDHEPCPSCEIG